MAVWYAQSNGQDFNDPAQWKNAGSETMTTVRTGWYPEAGDVFAANGKTGIVLNADFDIGTGRLSNATEGGTAGGGFVVTEARTITAAILGTSTNTTVSASGNDYTLTINGKVSAALGVVSSIALNVNGNITVNVSVASGEAINGGGGNGCRGITSNSTQLLTVVGDIGGGGGNGYAVNVGAGGIAVTGDVAPAGGTTACINSTGPVSVTGSVNAGTMTGPAIKGTSTVSVTNGPVTAGTGGAGAFAISSTGQITVTNSNIINTDKASAISGGVIYNPGAGNYIQYPATSGTPKYGKTIPAAKVLFGEVGDGVDLPAEGTVILPNQNHVWSSAPNYGAVVEHGSGTIQGNMAVPRVTDVRTGVYVGNGSENVLGTCAVPVPDVVLSPYPIDDVTGCLTLPAEDNVLDGVPYGKYGDENTGNYETVGVEDVAEGVTFGPSGSLEGTLAGSGSVIVIDD